MQRLKLRKLDLQVMSFYSVSVMITDQFLTGDNVIADCVQEYFGCNSHTLLLHCQVKVSCFDFL